AANVTLAGGDRLSKRDEAVNIALRLAVDNRHASVDQRGGISAALIADRIKAGRDDQRRRQIGERCRAQRRTAIMATVGRITFAEPVHAAFGEHITVSKLLERG